jgi:O-antigen ligase
VYGLATRLFPDRLGSFDPIATYRLSEPLGYWNGLAIFAAMGALVALGVVARDASLTARCLAGAAFPILVCTVFFTFSRGGWAALGIGFLAALAFDPRRLHLVVATLIVGIPAALALAAATSSEALTERDAALFAAVDQGRVVAVIVLACAALAAGAVAALSFAEERVHPSRSLRVAFATLLAVLAVGAAGVVLVNFGGPVALVEEAYDAFNAPPAPDPEELERRLFSFSGNYRPDLWEVAWADYRADPVVGSGAGTYEQYWNLNRPTAHIVRDAHSLYLETLAELGAIGLAILLIALGAPLLGAFRARREPLAVAAIGAYVAYLVHAAIDWDWELTGLSLCALGCAVALLALRTPRGAPLVPGVALRTGPPDFAEAKEQARKARRWAPWSSEPWQRLGEAQLAAGELAPARDSFRKAIAKEPTDWQLWFHLAEASSGAARRTALAEANRLNPLSPELAAFRQDDS